MIERYLDWSPNVDPTAFVHPTAQLIGDVTLGALSNVWPGVILRGDQGAIRIGVESNVQDGVIAHSTGGKSVTTIGARVTVGHRALLHGCVVEDGCLVGMGAILLDNCVVGAGSIIGAGALLPVGRRFPGGKLILGSPARVVRDLNDEDRRWIDHSVATYLRLAREHGTSTSNATQTA